MGRSRECKNKLTSCKGKGAAGWKMGSYRRKNGCYSAEGSWEKQEGAVGRKQAEEGMPPQGAGRVYSPGLINQVSLPESYTSP